MSDNAASGARPGVKPVPPNPEDYSGCCDGGCNPCVFDLYWEAQAQYEAALAEWQLQHAGENT
jgi:hypothetical protein